MQFRAPPKTGKYSMEVQLLSSCYMGLDVTLEIDFEVSPASELPEYMPHPEDVRLFLLFNKFNIINNFFYPISFRFHLIMKQHYLKICSYLI